MNDSTPVNSLDHYFSDPSIAGVDTDILILSWIVSGKSEGVKGVMHCPLTRLEMAGSFVL
jgi:hypothetical protein